MKSLFVIVIAVTLAAQAQEPAAVPVDQEPNHKVVFKNDYVRVIDATFPPGHVTLNHSHALDNVAVAISTGRDTAPGRAGFSKGGYSHRVTNSGTGVMRFIDVEILKSDRPGAAATSLPHHTLETENDRVRIYRVKLAAGESLPTHTHAAGWIEVMVTGGSGPGAYIWHGGGESSPLKGGPAEIVELEPK
jgi:quercetin dioxygenase-like cupin family protein